jgi:hypothetical protein
MSQRSGKGNNMWGRKHTAKSRKAIGLGQKGTKRSDPHRKKIGDSLKEAYASGRRKASFKKAQEARKRPVMVEGEFYSSIVEARTSLNLSHSSFYRQMKSGKIEVRYI